MADTVYAIAEQLIQKKAYQEAYDYIQQHIDETVASLHLYNMRNFCLMHLGRDNEMHNFPWDIINYKFPSKEDKEAVSYISKSLKANQWTMEGEFYEFRSYFIFEEVPLNQLKAEELELFHNSFQKDKVDVVSLRELIRYYYRINDSIKAIYYHALYILLTDTQATSNKTEEAIVLGKVKNSGAIYSTLLEDTTDTIAFMIDSVEDYYSYFQMAKVCQYFKKEAIFITAPIEWEVDEAPEKDVSVNLMLENAEEIDGVTCYTTLQYMKSGTLVEDTLLLLLDELSNRSKGNQLIVFTERKTLRRMKSPYVKRKAIHYVASNDEVLGIPYTTNFGYINGYDNFEKILYKVNIIDKIMKESQYSYSIVIPVRNNASTLEATLRTCLQQEYHDYEVLICDNSDDNEMAINSLVNNKFQSDKIRYIRTPRVYPISKSFEYAYIHAKGEFLIPIGADDGIVFNSLGYLNNTMKELEKKERINVLSWDRLHYVWPNLQESGQSGQFVVPKQYHRGEYKVEKRNSAKIIKDLLLYPKMMYSIPLAYINSGMNRHYMLDILSQTGAIIDGHSQDIYTGLVNLALNPDYYHLNFPITMAALSKYSSGAKSAIGSVNEEIMSSRSKEFYNTNMGSPAQRDGEDMFVVSDGDVANMLTQVFRLVDMECLDLNIVNQIYWEHIGKEIWEQMQYKDVSRAKVESILLKGIGYFSPEAAAGLKKKIENKVLEPYRYDLVKGNSFFKGFRENGALHLNAEELGVTNVYEACRLFDIIYHIY